MSKLSDLLFGRSFEATYMLARPDNPTQLIIFGSAMYDHAGADVVLPKPNAGELTRLYANEDIDAYPQAIMAAAVHSAGLVSDWFHNVPRTDYQPYPQDFADPIFLDVLAEVPVTPDPAHPTLPTREPIGCLIGPFPGFPEANAKAEELEAAAKALDIYMAPCGFVVLWPVSLPADATAHLITCLPS